MNEPLNPSLSQVVRRQLHDLRIDPDATAGRRSKARARFKTWCGRHKEPLLLGGGSVAALLLVLGVVLLVSSTLSQPGSRVANSPLPSAAAVSLGDTTVELKASAYRRYSPGEAMLVVHVNVRNAGLTRVQLLAGDVLLVDGHGVLFPPSWHDADGNLVDGLAQPRHAFLALDPGGEVGLDLRFLVLSQGPFTLRYEPHGDPRDANLPALSLALADDLPPR